MNQLIWRLSGPSLFLGRLAGYAHRGLSVVISSQYGTSPDLAVRICTSLRGEGFSTDLVPDAETPLKAVAEVLCCESESPSLDAICDACHGVRCLVVAIEDTGRATIWSQFLERLQHRARQNSASQRPALILIHKCAWPNSVPTDDVTVTSLSWDDAISRADLVSLSYSLLISRKLPGIARQVLAHTLAEISLTDIDLMWSISDQSPEEIAWPYNCLRTWAENRGLNGADKAPPRMYMEGQFLDHSAWLAWTGDQSILRRRVWAAQSRVLLPWVEEQRTRLLPELASWLPRDHDGQSQDELEVGSIDFLLSGTSAPSALRNKIRILKRTRNEMAHCGTLAYPNLLALSRLEIQ
jgi:hypothetical protein